MRLTLRTLLAYLDDLLEPAQAKELGAKIQESEMAAELIMKIRDVIRKRRLTAPLVNGAGCDMDANVVAEYLDNTLPPEGVAELEKICLESDTHLAEVAACHQILTLVLGEPVDIGTHSRDRMYALGLVAASNTASVVPHSAEHDATSAATSVNRKGATEADAPRRGDSFVGKVSAASAHPSASPPSRAVATGPQVGHSGQHAGLSGVLSAADHAAPASSFVAKSAASHSTAPTGLGPAVKSVSSSRPPAATAPVTAATDASANSARIGAAEPFDRTIPDYLKQPPLWKRALPLAILLLIAVWVGTLLKDKDLLTGLLKNQVESTAETPVPIKNEQPDAVAKNSAKAEETTGQATDPSIADTNQSESDSSADVTQTPTEVATAKPKRTEVAIVTPGVDAPPPPEIGDQPNPNDSVPEAPVPEEPEMVKPGRTEPKAGRNQQSKSPMSEDEIPEKKTTGRKTGTEVAAVDSDAGQDPAQTETPVTKTTKRGPAGQPGTDNRPQPVRYVSQDGVVLRFDDDRQGWFPLPHRQHIFAEDILAVPEPFDAQIQFGNEKHRLTAVGPTLLQVVETMDDLPLAINVERGRIILQPAESAAGVPPARMKLALNVQGQTWILELPDIHSRCGIEIIPREPHQFEENFGSQGWSGKLIIASGTVKITTPEGKAQIIKGPEIYILAPDASATTSQPTPASVVPAWMGDRKLASAAKINAAHFQKTLLQDELSAHDALLSAMEDRVPEKSRLATACLGLIGDYQMMLEVLDRNEHHESRETAITALRSWINLNPVNREKIKEEIAARFFKDDVDTIYRLIWGYQEQDLRGKQVSRQLVDWLSHDKLAVRECACHYIKTLTSRRFDFDARGSQTQRNAAIQQLEKVLDKDGALLPSLPKGAGTAVKRN